MYSVRYTCKFTADLCVHMTELGTSPHRQPMSTWERRVREWEHTGNEAAGKQMQAAGKLGGGVTQG